MGMGASQTREPLPLPMYQSTSTVSIFDSFFYMAHSTNKHKNMFVLNRKLDSNLFFGKIIIREKYMLNNVIIRIY